MISRGLKATGALVLASSMALGLTGQVEPVAAASKRPTVKPKLPSAFGKAAASPAVAGEVAESVPSTYRVVAGDTVSSIAGRYGLSTASVLALNGLGWTTLIFPGQDLKLGGASSPTVAEEAPLPDRSGRYTIVAGDTISGIADRFGVSTQSVLTANGLGWSSIIYPGQTIAIPGIVDFTQAIQPIEANEPDPAPVPAPDPARIPSPSPRRRSSNQWWRPRRRPRRNRSHRPPLRRRWWVAGTRSSPVTLSARSPRPSASRPKPSWLRTASTGRA